MTLFLTSHTGGWKRDDGNRIPTPLDGSNGFCDQLKCRWKPDSRVLLIAAAADSHERNDSICRTFSVSFPLTGLSVRDITLCDGRNEAAVQRLSEYDCILLSGGHVPTQNAFFHKIGLKDKIRSFRGILIGISAGTMNCAQTVYAHPELEGEAIDPGYSRFLPGLGLTELMILPHYQSIRDDTLDGLRVFEDIAYPDSMGRAFLALNDGSYVLAENGVSTLYGEARLIRNGAIHQICRNGEHIRI